MKKLLTTLVAAPLLIGSMSGCGSKKDPAIEIWHPFADSKKETFEKMITDFNNDNGTNFVAFNKGRVSQTDDLIWTNMSSSSVDVPIIWVGIHDYITQYYVDSEAKDFLVDMDALKDKVKAEDASFVDNTSNINQEALDMGNKYGDGKRYSLPLSLETEHLFVNHKLVKDTYAGITAANPVLTKIEAGTALTWDDLEVLNANKPSTSSAKLLQMEWESYLALQNSIQTGWNYVDATTKKSSFKDNTELKRFTQTLVDDLNVTTHREATVDDKYASDYFAKGDIMFLQAGPQTVDYITNKAEKELKMLPVIQDNTTTQKSILKGFSVTMFDEKRSDKELSDAYKLLNTMLTKENHQKMVDEGFLSFRSDVAATTDTYGMHASADAVDLESEVIFALTEGEGKFSTDIRTRMGQIIRRYKLNDPTDSCVDSADDSARYDCIAADEHATLIKTV